MDWPRRPWRWRPSCPSPARWATASRSTTSPRWSATTTSTRWPLAPRLFAEGAWAGAGEVNPIYRPLTSLTYALNHAVGGLDPAGYHLLNVLLHALCAVLVLRLGRVLGATLLAATAAALLFAVHPVHVEVVANVAGRKDALATALIIATLLAHRMALARGGWRLALPVLAFGAALLSKETGAVALGIVAAWDLLLEPAAWRTNRRRALALYAGYAAVLLLYLLARHAAVGSSACRSPSSPSSRTRCRTCRRGPACSPPSPCSATGSRCWPGRAPSRPTTPGTPSRRSPRRSTRPSSPRWRSCSPWRPPPCSCAGPARPSPS